MDTASQIVLRSPRWKLCVPIPFFLVLMVAGVWELRTGEFWWGVATVSLFGLATLSAVLALISDRFYSLRIDSLGLTYYSLFRCRHLSWNAIDTLAVTHITHVSRSEFVAWNYSANAERPAPNVFMDMSLLDFDAGCPAIGMPAKTLLAVMQQFRSQHASSKAL
jgi:hypothetical protein